MAAKSKSVKDKNYLLRLKYCLKKHRKYPRSKYFVPLAQTYIALELLEEASQVLQEGLKWHPSYFIGRALLAQTYYKMGHFIQSNLEAQKVVDSAPTNLLGLKIAILSHLKLHEYEKAKVFLEQLSRIAPDDPHVLSLSSELSQKESTPPGRIEDFQMVELSNIFSENMPPKSKKIKLLNHLLDTIHRRSPRK